MSVNDLLGTYADESQFDPPWNFPSIESRIFVPPFGDIALCQLIVGELGLSLHEYAIVGSRALALHGYDVTPDDTDLVVALSAFKRFVDNPYIKKLKYDPASKFMKVSLGGMEIDITANWCELWMGITEKIILDSIKYSYESWIPLHVASLEDIRKTLWFLRRTKDEDRLAAVEQWVRYSVVSIMQSWNTP